MLLLGAPLFALGQTVLVVMATNMYTVILKTSVITVTSLGIRLRLFVNEHRIHCRAVSWVYLTVRCLHIGSVVVFFPSAMLSPLQEKNS